MPTYSYRCVACGPFDLVRPMAEAGERAVCPACGGPGRRTFGAPALSTWTPACGRRSRPASAAQRLRRSCAASRPQALAVPCGRPPTRGTPGSPAPEPARAPATKGPTRVLRIDAERSKARQQVKDSPCPRSCSRSTTRRSSPTSSTSATTAGTRTSRPQVSVKPGDVFRADCREWFDGAINNDDSAEDVRNAPLAGRARAQRAVPRRGRRARRPARSSTSSRSTPCDQED